MVHGSSSFVSLAPAAVGAGAYRRYKSRHGLLSRSQFARLHGPQAWVRAELCFVDYDRAQRSFGKHNVTRAPLGVAVDYALVTV
jgi:hypothetical protein